VTEVATQPPAPSRYSEVAVHKAHKFTQRGWSVARLESCRLHHNVLQHGLLHHGAACRFACLFPNTWKTRDRLCPHSSLPGLGVSQDARASSVANVLVTR